MRVKCLVDVWTCRKVCTSFCGGETYAAGDEADLPDTFAAKLIAENKAVRLDLIDRVADDLLAQPSDLR